MLMMCSDELIIEMAKLAILASKPLGMGFLHYKSNLKKEDIELSVEYNQLSVDYYQGRMVKFYAHKDGDRWTLGYGVEPSPEYQSWSHTYLTYDDLAVAASETLAKQGV